MEFGTHFDSNTGNFKFLIILVIFTLFEALWIIFRQKQYPWKEAGASFLVAFIKRVIDLATAGASIAFMLWVYQYRLWTIEVIDHPFVLLGLFLLVEFAYYWHHRFSHITRWIWATHSVHHSPNHMNLSVAGRLGWTSLLSGSILFFAPLSLIGFHPIAIFLMLAAGLFYQVWIHTELIKTLGPLEWILNTPAHHRVHHGSNAQYIDKNFGGVLIIFDRLFGTFEKEEQKVIYGLIKPMHSNNPFKIALFEWIHMFADLRHAQSTKHGLKILFGRP